MRHSKKIHLTFSIFVATVIQSCSSTGTYSGISEQGASASQAIIWTSSVPARFWLSVGAYQGSDGLGSCTGTAIGPYYFLTAGHCVSRNFANDHGNPRVTLFDASGNARQTTPVVEAIPSLNNESTIIVTKDLLQAEPLRVYEYPLDSTWITRPIFAMGYGGQSLGSLTGGWVTIQDFPRGQHHNDEDAIAKRNA